MKNIVDAIIDYKKSYNKDIWELPTNVPLEIPNSIEGNYEKNIFLKKNIFKILKNDDSLNTHYWIIQEWGGISSFKKNPKNDLRIRKFLNEISIGKLSKDSFSCISSLSKIASFLDPENFVIYDSRAIYSLNWLIFNHGNPESLYPQPAGRNAEIVKYDMATIFRLSGRSFDYKSYDIAFHHYCDCIKSLNEKVYGSIKEPYLLEMLLFSIATPNVIDSIKKRVKVNIS